MPHANAWQSDAPNLGFSEASPWLPADQNHAQYAVDQQQKEGASVLHFTRDMLRWRKTHPALEHGSCRVLAFNASLMVLERHFTSPEGSQTLIIALNASNQDATIRLNLPASATSVPVPHMKAGEPSPSGACCWHLGRCGLANFIIRNSYCIFCLSSAAPLWRYFQPYCQLRKRLLS